MGKWVHRLSNIDESTRTATCASCGLVALDKKKQGKGKGTIWRCQKQANRYNRSQKAKYKRHKQLRCDRCGFIAEHKCQLDVHHRDGNHSNDSTHNLQTLCANCHRLVTHEMGHP